MAGTPVAASCNATCRPTVPTPTTTAWHRASRSGGTKSRWRTSRSARSALVELMETLPRGNAVDVSGRRDGAGRARRPAPEEKGFGRQERQRLDEGVVLLLP